MTATGEIAMAHETTLELKGECEIVITRIIDGPARIVFDVYTKPEHLKRWWAPKSRGVVLTQCEAELKVGGAYRYVMSRGGQDMAFSGKYVAFAPPSRLVYTQVFEPMAGMGETLVTVSFEEVAGKTLMTTTERYPSKQVREAVLATGMEGGMRESMDQLEALVVELR